MVGVVGRIMTPKDAHSLILRSYEDSHPLLFSWDVFQDPQWVPETSNSTKPCMYFSPLYIDTFSLEGSTLRLHFDILELLASVLSCFGAN